MRYASWFTVMALLAAIAGTSPAAADSRPVNLNTASVAELTTLKGIGESKAQAIVAFREKHGGFKTVDDLKEVAGIGDKLVEQLRPQVSVGAAEKGETAKKQ